MAHQAASIAALQETYTMTREAALRIAQLTGALQFAEKLISALTQQTAAIHKQINDLKETNQ